MNELRWIRGQIWLTEYIKVCLKTIIMKRLYKKIYLKEGLKRYSQVDATGVPTDEYLLTLPKTNDTLAVQSDINYLKEQLNYFKIYFNQLASK